jgi:hypothetical protein
VGSLRSIKTTVRAEQRAVEETKDRQWEQDYTEWLNDPDGYWSDHFCSLPGCFGSPDLVTTRYIAYCYTCRFMEYCELELCGGAWWAYGDPIHGNDLYLEDREEWKKDVFVEAYLDRYPVSTDDEEWRIQHFLEEFFKE